MYFVAQFFQKFPVSCYADSGCGQHVAGDGRIGSGKKTGSPLISHEAASAGKANEGVRHHEAENRAIGKYAGSFGYGVVRDLCGHGIGSELHEEPEIPNFRQFRWGVRLRPGMTLAIEPMINIGLPDVLWLDDEWTVITEDMSLSAHYENTVLITKGEPEILTLTDSEIAAGIGGKKKR